MARLRRAFQQGVSAHIIKRGNNRSAVFSQTHDYEHFLACVADAACGHGVSVHAYVLMTNHIHLLATPDQARSMPAFMKQVGERYSMYFNRAYGRIGTPWTGRYRALLISDERYWLTCLRYIELNPVRAQVVVRPDDYAWSSFSAHAAGEDHPWLRTHPLFESLGRSRWERSDAYRRLCSAALTEDEVRTIRKPPRRWGQTPGSDPDGNADSGAVAVQ